MPSNEPLTQFYAEHGIQQKTNFSGGFRCLQIKKERGVGEREQVLTGDRLFSEFGLKKSTPFVRPYKREDEYVPESKGELADRLIEKIEHERARRSYFREKYYG